MLMCFVLQQFRHLTVAHDTLFPIIQRADVTRWVQHVREVADYGRRSTIWLANAVRSSQLLY